MLCFKNIDIFKNDWRKDGILMRTTACCKPKAMFKNLDTLLKNESFWLDEEQNILMPLSWIAS